MNDMALVDAVRRVLPAVNLQPGQFNLERGFLARARRRGQPTVIALNDMARQLVFLDSTPNEGGPETVVAAKTEEALGALDEAARAVCTYCIALWTNSASDFAHAAAFMVPEAAAVPPRLLGVSWMSPDSWPEPMIDPAVHGDDSLTRALERLALLVGQQRGDDGFDAAFVSQVALIDLELEYRGGHGQGVSARPSRCDTANNWSDWLKRYERSVRDEWFLITGAQRPKPPTLLEPTAGGPLSGIRVFLSYALPDETDLALPVHEALRACGASVWFDRDRELDVAWLNAGLADTIAACDAYVMCASDEFVERAGYATQEVAWAVMHRAVGSQPIKLVVVDMPGTVLPTIVAEWPLVELRSGAGQDFERQLSNALLSPPAAAPPFHPPRGRTVVTRLALQADLVAMRERVKHLRRFEELPEDTVAALILGRAGGARIAHARDVLRHSDAGLGWSGTLGDLVDWPADSFVRDLRWRLAAARAIAATRQPLSNDASDDEAIAHDIELLTCRHVPITDWDAVPGWADNERRLALRYHAGLLRALTGLFAHGLVAGLTHVSSGTLTAWESNITARRVECYDALLGLRLHGALSWGGEPATWDSLFRAWSALVARPPHQWREVVPRDLLLTLVGTADDIASVAAQTCWTAAYDRAPQTQQFTFGTAMKPMHATVSASVSGSMPEEQSTGVARRVILQLLTRRGQSPEITLLWSDLEGDGNASPSGKVTLPAPEPVSQVFNRSSI